METHWRAYQDDEGRTYYHNEQTQETTWERPVEYSSDVDLQSPQHPYDQQDPWVSPTTPTTSANQTPIQHSPWGDEVSASPHSINETNTETWVLYKDDQDRPYYYNPTTQTTQWEVPQGTHVEIVQAEDDETKPATMETEEDKTCIHETKEETNPEAIALQQAQTFLQQPDAILEPNVLQYLDQLVSILGGQVGGVQAVTSLVQGYVGQSTLCGLWTQWVLLLQQDTDIQRIQSIINKVLTKLAITHFSKLGEDLILNLPKSKRDFLKDMLEYPEWRRLVLQLAESTKRNSALLNFCLQSISEQGHHREIARTMSQSGDYFRVFHNLLIHELVIVAVGDKDSTTTNYRESLEEETVTNLQRTCSSSAFTYTYAISFVRHLIQVAEDKMMLIDDVNRDALQSRIQKWKRLVEKLEEYMIKPPDSHIDSSIHGNPMLKKRRANLALVVHDVHSKLQKRILSPNKSNGISSSMKLFHSLQSGILSLMKRYSIGMPVEDHTLDQLLHNLYDETDEIPRSQGGTVGLLLTQSPLAITCLMEVLFLHGSTHGKSKSLEVRMKCAKLLALSVLSAESFIYKSNIKDDKNLNTILDESVISKALLQTSQLLFDHVENMVSITVTDKFIGSSNVSVGHQLSHLCIEHAIVAKGFLMWAKEKCQGAEFASSATYPTMAPGILNFARVICKYHPMCRHSTIEVAFLFLSHSNVDLSYTKIQTLKEQALRLILITCAQGLSLEVLNAMSNKLHQSDGSAELDSALIRYFVEGLIDIVRPPLSLPFARSMGGLLTIKACVEALKSTYFDSKKRDMLYRMVHDSLSGHITLTVHHNTTTSDLMLVDSLKSYFT